MKFPIQQLHWERVKLKKPNTNSTLIQTKPNQNGRMGPRILVKWSNPLEPKKCNLVADKKRDAKDCKFSLYHHNIFMGGSVSASWWL